MKPTHSCFLVLILTLLSVCSRAGAYTSGQFLTGSNTDNNYSCVAVGPGNVFYGAWKANNPAPSYIKFATFNGTAWTEIPSASFTGPNVAAQLPALDGISDWGPESMVVDTTGNIHIIFGVGASAGGAGSLRGLVYGKFTAGSGTWAFRRLFILQHASGFRNVGNGDYSLKLDASQNPHVVFQWSDASDDPTREARIQYAFFNGTVWNVSGNTNAMDAIQIDVSTFSNQEEVKYLDTVFDSAGDLHCCYSKERADQITADAWYSKRTGGTWSAPVEIAHVGDFYGGYMVSNSSNHISIADVSQTSYGAPSFNYRIITNATGSFVASNVASYTPPGSTSTTPGIALIAINSAGRRVIGVPLNASNGATNLAPQYRLAYETAPGVWAQEAAFTDATTQSLSWGAMNLRSDSTVMALFHRSDADYTPDVRNLYFATGIPTGFGGAAGVAINSLNRVNPTPTNATTVDWTLTFSAATTGVTASNFSLGGAAAAGASVGTPTTSDAGINWNVPVTTGSTDGTLTLTLANATGFSPAISTALPFAGQSYEMDKTRPTVSIGAPSVSSTSTGPVDFLVTYADAQFNSSTLGSGDITLNTTGSANGTATVTGSGTTRTVTISAITGSGTIGITVAAGTATDTAGNTNLVSSPSATFTVVSANADLSALSTTATGMTPAFAANTLAYNATVLNAVTSTTVTATRAQANATLQVQVNGGGFSTLTSGVASGPLALNVGANPIDVRVTAQDGVTIKTYTLTVTRAAPPPVPNQVINTNNSGAGSLRDIVAAAAPGSTVTFEPILFSTPQIITLTTGEILISKTLTIAGPGADLLTVSGNNASRAFQGNLTGSTVTISGLRITACNSGGGFGGGLRSNANLVVKNCEITGNVAGGSGGGGIQVTGASGTFLNCSISNNTSLNQGGGIGWQPSSSAHALTVINCTLSGNSAIGTGGAGAGIGGGITLFASTASTSPAAVISNCTFANNIGSGVNGSALRLEAGAASVTTTLSIFSTIFANHTPATPALATRLSGGGVSATITSLGYNLSTNGGDGFLTATGDLVNANPMLEALALNDGPTRTHKLLPGSQALGASNAALRPADAFDLDGDLDAAELLPVDQRGIGFKRVSGGSMDIGAYEFPQPAAPVASAGGEGVVTGGNAPDPTGADSGLDFSIVTRSGFIAENGNLAFASEFTGPGVGTSNFKGFFKHDGTSLKRLARTGDNAPETGATAAKFSDLPLIPGINDDGQVTLFAQLAPNPASTPATTVDNDTGLWSELGGTGFQILIRENDQIPGLTAGILLDRFGSGCFATAKLLDSPPGTGRGEAAFTVTFKGGSTDSALLRCSIIGADTTAVSVVAQENTAAPGVAGESFTLFNSNYTDAVRMDAQGNIVFGAYLKPSYKTSLWYQPVTGGTPVKAMVAGDAAPGTTATFAALDVPSMGDSGTFAFRGVLNADGDNAANNKNDGIWLGTTAGGFSNILRRGDSNSNRPGLFVNSTMKAGNIYSGWLNNSNHGVWLGWVDTAGDGASAYPADTFGIYTDLSGTMKLLISSGDTAPGMPVGATMFFVDHPVVSGKSPNEYLAFLATVTGGGTTANNSKGIWRSLNGAAPTLVLRTGDSMTVTPGGSKVIYDIDIPGSGYDGHIWETPVMDGNGRLLVNVTFIDGTTTQVIIP